MKHRKFHKKLIIFFIIFISFEYSKCLDCSNTNCNINNFQCQNSGSNNCPSDCKPKNGANTCHDCTGIQPNDYYSINSDGTCLKNQCIGDKIIEIDENLKECTFQTITPSGKIYQVGELGEYYYFFSSVDSNKYVCTGNICKCKTYYYIETIFGKKKYTCIASLSGLSSTNYKYYNYHTGQLFQTDCPSGYEMKKTDASSGFTRCSNACIGSEKIKQVQNNDNNFIEYYCVDDCSNESPYIYEYTDNNGNKKCLENCPSGTYKLNNNKCVTLDQCQFFKGDTCYTSCTNVPPEDSTSYHYHNYGSKECISSCTGINIYTKDTISSDTDKICYSSCLEIPGGEYIYEVFSSPTYICYTSVPSSNCDFYYKKNDGIIKCTTKSDCVTNNKNYIINKECKDSCDGYYQIEMQETSPSINYIKCFETSNKAFADSDVKFCDTQLRKCWNNFPDNEGYYIKSQFGTNSGKYELTKQCDNFYLQNNDNSITNGDLYWCVSNCKNNGIISEGKFFVSGNKECKASCSDFYKYYYDDSNNECLDSCELRHGKQFSYLTNPICQSGCDNDEFYNYNSHICLTNCGDDNSINLYYKNTEGSARVCYPSCLDIPTRGTYKYIIDNYKCITESEKTTDNCGYYYKYNGMFKCVTASDCYNEGYKYLKDSECTNKCNDNDYKMKKTIGTGVDQVTMELCISSISSCQTEAGGESTIIYYHENLKMCWKDYQTIYFYKTEPNSGDTQIELVDSCDNFYYIDESSKKCVNTCKEKNLYYIAGNNKCIENTDCTSNHKYYYDPLNNECLDTCKGRPNYGTQKELDTTTLQICLSNCQKNVGAETHHFYYNHDSNICMDYCGKDGSDKIYHAEDGYICYSSCSEIPGDYKYGKKTTVEGSSPSIYNYICYSTSSSDNCNYYYLNSDGSKKCQDAIDCFNMNYIYLIENSNSQYICTNQCDNYYKLDIIIRINSEDKQFIQCFQDYNDCYNYINQLGETPTNDPIYYNEKAKRCWQTPPDYYYIIDNSDNSNKFKVVEKCDKYYYIDNNNYKYCTTTCKTTDTPSLNLYFYAGNQKCAENCGEFEKLYYDPDNNECLNTCLGKEGKEYSEPDNAGYYICSSDCQNNEFYDYDSKICIEKCGYGNSLYLYHTNIGDGNSQDQICYPSCKDIPNGNYVYESQDGNDNIKTCSTTRPTDSGVCEYYYMKKDGSKKCITSASDCITNGFDYLYGKECLKKCEGYFVLQDEPGTNIPKECFLTLSEALQSNKGIKYYHQNLRQCWKNYPSDFYIKSKDNDNHNDNWEVIENCDKFYYEQTSGTTTYKYCVDNCKIDNTLNLYFIQNQQKCETECQKYYDPTNNECLNTCIGRTNLEYSNPIPTPSSPQPCLNKCPKYFIKKKDNSNNIIAYECITDCSPTDSTYKYIDVKTNECLTECPSDNTIEVNGKCYPKCDVNNNYRYIDIDTYNCVLSCPSYLKKMVYLASIDDKEIYLCNSMCQENEYRLEEKCLQNCPEEYNYVGNNKICKHQNCKGDLNGELYYKKGVITKEDGATYPLYICINSCQDVPEITQAYLYKEECLENCPIGTFTFEHSCLSECPDNYPYSNTNDDTNPYYYKCHNENICDDKYLSNGACVNQCPGNDDGKKYIDSHNMCMDKCRDDEYNQKDENDNSIILCKKVCREYKYQKNIESVLECVKDCPEDKHFIGKNNICKESCEEEDGINFYEIEPSDSTINYKIFLCTSGCPENYRYREANNENSNQCYQNCPRDYPYKSEEELKCYSNCLESGINKYTLKKYDTDGTTIIPDKCDKQCDQNSAFKYYGQDKICITSCSLLGSTKLTNTYNNECVDKCDLNTEYRFQLNDKCVQECESDDPNTNPKKRYSLRDYICKEKCDEDENIVKEGRICSDTCDGFLNPLNQEEYECLPSCSKSPYLYYYETEKKCLSQCNSEDKVVKDKNICVSNCADLTDKKYYFYEKDNTNANDFNKCLLNCPENKPLIYEDKCVNSCPTEQKYYVGEIRHEDYHKCKNDCPSTYPYYKIVDNALDNTKQDYVCIERCVGFYVPNSDTNVIATLCLDSCPNGIYKYQIGNDKCYQVCPQEAKYHFDLDSTPVTHNDNNCYESCPEIQSGKTFHKRGETICLTIQELSDIEENGYILYEEKEWISTTNAITSCPNGLTTKAEASIYLSRDIIICSNECTEYGQYLTPYNTCVNDCENSALARNLNLINDENNKKCVCKKLFYIDENSHKKICYPDTVTSCKDTNDDYKIPLKPTSECLKYCSSNRILNPSEDECYEAGTRCSTINANTELVTVEGKLKCDCKYKFYYYNNNEKKACLEENDVCPERVKKYLPDTMQCIESCPSDRYTFKNYCLRECPSGSTINEASKTCDCGDRFWYKVSEGNYECLNQDSDCLDKFPLYSEDKECLVSCKNTYYPYLFENKCYDKCEVANTEKVSIPSNSPLSTYAVYKCDCLRPWYYELDSVNNKEVMHCPSATDNKKECKDYGSSINKINMIEETRQCLEECPTEYKYLFNELCFTSCEYANDKYKFNIETVESSLVCNCQNLWHKNTTDPAKKICYEKSRNECPTETEPNNYLIYNTKECVDDSTNCPSNSFKFNHICYDKCPEFSLEGNNGDNDCICDKGHLWLKYKKYGTEYYKCGLETCPETSVGDNYLRMYLLESENQCVRSCLEEGPTNNDYKYGFRDKCVNKCPTETKIVNYVCTFYDVKSPGYVYDLEDLKEKANIQSKELYEGSGSISGFIKHDFGASLQIYALNKINSYKELAMQSNLTYIDLGTCLDKIYAANNLKDSDNILVTKYDLLERTHKSTNNNDGSNGGGGATSPSSGNTYTDDNYLINQVEYEFYIQSNNKKIEGSICSPYEIEISYPIFYNKNKYNNYLLGQNKNNYLKQFMIGKNLHSKDQEIDTFNKDNKVYKDMCIGVEINGKDLVFEDRYNYLYPNNVSLCESNCTMKNTDFDLQRINCMCTYKEIIDFKRNDEDTNDILNDPDFEKPSQSSANAQIIKCITKIGVKEGVKNNEAFYFCTVGSGIIVIMSIVSAFTAVKTVANFMNGMLKLNGANNFQNNNHNNNIATSANRLINNPPKKGELNETKDNNNDNSDNNDKGNIVIKKNIKLNYNQKNDIENDISEISINNDNSSNIKNKTMNYGINIKSTIPRIRNNRSNNISNKNNYTQYQTNNDFSNKKAEFIPTQYNFKFFKPGDKGVVKKLFRSELPFEVDKDTKILLEVKNGISYDEKYLEGPYYDEQNIIEIIDDNKNNNNIELNTNSKNNKIVKFSDNNNKSNKKNNTKVDITNYINIKQDNDDGKKRCITNNLNSTDKEFIKIKKINPITNLNIAIDNYRADDEIKDVDNTTSIYTLMKREHTFLRVTYEKYMSKNHPNILATFLAEILDKIYLIKILIFLKKFEILSIQVALYIFYHILLLSLLCGFFTIKTIKKIWEEANYPTINFYLLYGLISHIIIWIIYKIFILVLDNQDKIRALVKLNNEAEASKENSDENQYGNKKEEINDKYKDLIKNVKIQILVFYLVIIALTVFCFLYLVSFFAIYTGTKSKVLKAYYISLIEIVLIKFVYGLCLGSLRIAAEGNELKSLYNFVYVFDKYFS